MNIFITGGLTGMGMEAAKIFLKDGHTIGICSFQSTQDASSILLEGAFYYQADVTDNEAMRKAIYGFKEDVGQIDLVFANAGISHPKTTVPDWKLAHKVIDVNIKGVLNTFEPAIEIMQEQMSGHLVATASIAAFSGLPGMGAYGGSKAFVKNFAETLALDMQDFNINVTLLAPGFVLTPLTEKNSHKMPFMITQEQAGQEIVNAVYKKKKIHVFPRPFKFVATLLNDLPRPMYRFLMEKKVFDPKDH